MPSLMSRCVWPFKALKKLTYVILWMAYFLWGTNFCGFLGGSDQRISVPTK